MACNCGKKKLTVQPKKIIKTQPSSGGNNSINTTKRIIRRAAR